MSAVICERVPTAFEARVYEALRRIPRGRVTTYGRLAAAVGCGSARAVGQALRRNPFAPEVPCHRVVGSDGRVGGYLGEVAGARVMEKMERLEREGVRLAGGRLAKGQPIWEFHED
jgi:methylated-DNA-[protein]-cysteine S-methyltransferase